MDLSTPEALGAPGASDVAIWGDVGAVPVGLVSGESVVGDIRGRWGRKRLELSAPAGVRGDEVLVKTCCCSWLGKWGWWLENDDAAVSIVREYGAVVAGGKKKVRGEESETSLGGGGLEGRAAQGEWDMDLIYCWIAMARAAAWACTFFQQILVHPVSDLPV